MAEDEKPQKATKAPPPAAKPAKGAKSQKPAKAEAKPREAKPRPKDYKPRMKSHYETVVREALSKKFAYKNHMKIVSLAPEVL